MAAGTQPRFEALDALRGAAASVVVLFHLGHWLDFPSLATNGNLAVDFFFCLSGFVLPLGYGAARAPRMTFRAFLRHRAIRLGPIILLASALSAGYVLARMLLKGDSQHFGELIMAFALGVFSLPYIGAPTVIGGPQIFPLNGPQYTLFLEIAVNIVWFIGRRLFGLRTSLCTALACIGLLAIVGIAGDTSSTIFFGFPRVGASFFLGVALFHMHQDGQVARWHDLLRQTFLPLLLAFLAVCLVPWPLGNTAVIVWIAVGSPLVVAAGSVFTPSVSLLKCCAVMGAMSYPIYALHYPIFCWLNGSVVRLRHAHTAIEVPTIFGCVMILSLAVVYWYDKPVRRWLTTMSVGPRSSVVKTA